MVVTCYNPVILALIFLSIFQKTKAIPTTPVVLLNSKHGTISQQDLYHILHSIDERLRTMNSVYSYQPSMELENRVNEIQGQLENVDEKLNVMKSHIEILSEKLNNKPDSNGELSRTLDDIIDKQEEVSTTIHAISNNIIEKLEKMEDNFIRRDEETKGELSDIIGIIEDIKMPYDIRSSIYNDSLSDINFAEKQICQKVTTHLEDIKLTLGAQLNITNWTSIFIQSMKTELETDLNAYANKVADMSSEFWEANEIIDERMHSMISFVNTSKVDVQNTLKKFMMHLSKRFNKWNSSSDYSGDGALEEISFINANLEKILSTQSLFLESCYRLQKDDSQIESRIDSLLQEITDTLQAKTIIGSEKIENIETLMKNHESRMEQYTLQGKEKLQTSDNCNNQNNMDRVDNFNIRNVRNLVDHTRKPKLVLGTQNNEDMLINENLSRKSSIPNGLDALMNKVSIEETKYSRSLYKFLESINPRVAQIDEIQYKNIQTIFNDEQLTPVKIVADVSSRTENTESNDSSEKVTSTTILESDIGERSRSENNTEARSNTTIATTQGTIANEQSKEEDLKRTVIETKIITSPTNANTDEDIFSILGF